MTFVFFTDRDLGTRFPETLKSADFSVERHADHFPPDCPDEDWLAEVGKREWVALTHNLRIRYYHRRLAGSPVHRWQATQHARACGRHRTGSIALLRPSALSATPGHTLIPTAPLPLSCLPFMDEAGHERVDIAWHLGLSEEFARKGGWPYLFTVANHAAPAQPIYSLWRRPRFRSRSRAVAASRRRPSLLARRSISARGEALGSPTGLADPCR